MNMEYDLIYDFNEHGLYYDVICHVFIEREITLTISDTIQLSFDYDTGNLVCVAGFLPLIKAIKKKIEVYDFIIDNYYIEFSDIQYLQGVGYNLFDFFEESKDYFIKDEMLILHYDEINKRILLGTQEETDKYIKINKNIYCGFDKVDNLKSLLITVDKIVNR